MLNPRRPRTNARFGHRLLVGWLAAAALVPAAGQTLLTHPQAELRAADLQADWARLPAQQAHMAQSSARAVRMQADALLVRRVLAQQAAQQGLADDPIVQVQLQLARERVLSDALLARLDERAVSDPQALEHYARAQYQGNPKRFEVPEQVRVRHILLRGDDAAERAEQVLARLRAGEDFATVASEVSQDPGSARNGGDLGFFGRGRMVAPFEEAAFALKQPGELSGPVRTEFGVHILKLEARRAAGVLPFEEVRAQLIEEAAQALRQQARVELRDAILNQTQAHDAAIEALVRPAPSGR